jgi:uncharacterized protein YqgV (UPF0045/DUF77 family)
MMKKITLLFTLFIAAFGFSQNLPFDFSSANQLMSGGDGAVITIVQDDANDVLQIVGAQHAWDHAAITFEDNIDLSDDANNTITFKIKVVNGTGNGVHLLKFEGGVAGPATAEMAYTTTGTEWQTVTVDFGAGLGNYSKMVLFVDSGVDNAGVSDTYLVDDISGAKHTTVVVEAPNLPFDFSSVNQLMIGGDGAVATIVQDDANDVLQIVGATHAWDHAAITFKDNIDLSDDANNTITFKIKAVNGTGSGVHLLKFEGGVAGPATAEMAYTTSGTEWQTVTVDFGAGLGNYSKMVLFVDAGADNAGVSDTYLVDDISGAKHTTVVVEAPNLPFDFSSANQLMIGGDGAVATIVQDDANDVLQIVGATHAWDHAAITFKDNIDLSDDANNTITFKIKAVNGTGSGVHLLKFEGGVAGPATAEMAYTTSGTEWQTVTVDFGVGLGNYAKMVLFVDSGADNAGVSDTYLVDDIALSASTGGPSDNDYCEKVVAHLGIASGQEASEIKLTVENSGEKSMKVTIESNNEDAVDLITIPGDVTGSPTLSAVDSSVAGKMSITLTWPETAPTDVALNILWSKVSTAGNWQLGNAPTTFKFAATCATASVSDNELLNISMYPNPASSSLNISAPNTIKSAAIYNILGKQVMSLNINKNSKSIDISNLASGIYFLKYNVNDKVGTAKFIKQ